MRIRSLLVMLGVALMILAAGPTSYAAPEASPEASPDASPDAVLDWNLTAVNVLTGIPGPAGGAPPASAIHVAMVQGAVYDAVNAIEPKHHRPYLLKRRFAATASEQAAVSTAAHDLQSDIIYTLPANIQFQTRASLVPSAE